MKQKRNDSQCTSISQRFVLDIKIAPIRKGSRIPIFPDRTNSPAQNPQIAVLLDKRRSRRDPPPQLGFTHTRGIEGRLS